MIESPSGTTHHENDIDLNLLDLLQRAQPPIPWQEGDNIPWNEPAFSARMLSEHLTQAHDRASRRSHLIDQHIAWIHQELLQERPARILDLGCGPGLYSNRLALLGHSCVGIDYSPASIAYAQEYALQTNLAATYLHEDMRAAPYGEGYDFVMLLFGELNVFSRADAATILAKSYAALEPGGLLLLEPHVYDSLVPAPNATNQWFSSPGGLFSPSPHLVLTEEHWNPAISTLTRRYYVVDATTAAVTRYAQSMQAYTPAEYKQLLSDVGFANTEILPGLAHDRITPASEFHAIVAQKPT
jgi:SAM-dependent methyltransferase